MPSPRRQYKVKDMHWNTKVRGIYLENLHWIRMHPYSHEFNLNLKDEDKEVMVKEVEFFKFEGGGTIVDNTVTGIDRDHMKLMQISEQTGIHIVCGTGYYLDHTLTDSVKSDSVECLTKVQLIIRILCRTFPTCHNHTCNIIICMYRNASTVTPE